MILSPDQYPCLPKWPYAFVTGESVTVEQAKDILFRTDQSVSYISRYGFGNDRAFTEKCVKLFGWEAITEAEEQWYKLKDLTEAERDAEIKRICPPESNAEHLWDFHSQWAAEMKMVSTEYVKNSWLSTSYLGGPSGWCSPTGQILYDCHNYGKYPSVEEVVDDWNILLAAFPYIKVVCTLHNLEHSEAGCVPVCTIVVGDGQVVVHSPDLTKHNALQKTAFADDEYTDRFFRMIGGDYSYERGWPVEFVEEFGVKSTAAMNKIAPHLTKL